MSQEPLNFLNLLIQPPGDLLYFLAVIAISQVAFFMALGQRSRLTRAHNMRRYMLSTLAIVLTWGFLMIGALFAVFSDNSPDTILPVLERAANVITILLIGWAFLTADHPRWGRFSNFILLDMVALVIVGYVITGVQWARIAEVTDFNTSMFGVTWTFVPTILVILGIIMSLAYFRHIPDAPLKLVFFSVLLVGHVFTLVQIAQGSITGDYPGAIRLAFVAALPLLPVIIYRTIVNQLETEVVSLRDTSARPQTPPDIKRTSQTARAAVVPGERQSAQLLKALGIILDEATPQQLPEKIIESTLQVLQADIGVLLRVGSANYADIMLGRDRVMNRNIGNNAVNLDSQPTLNNAIERQLQRPLYTERNTSELDDLYTRFDIEHRGPTYLQPLVSNNQVLAVLVVGQPYSRRELDENEQELLKGVGIIAAKMLALSFAADKAREETEQRIIQSITDGLPAEYLSDEAAMAAWQNMQTNLQAARQQLSTLNDQVTTLKVELDDERSRVATSLGDTEEGLSVSQQMLALHDEQERLRAENTELTTQLRESEAALTSATATDNASAFKLMTESLRRERDELITQRNQLEAQITQIRATGNQPMPAIAQSMLERMLQEKTDLENERNRLLDRIGDIETQLRALGIEVSETGLAQLIQQLSEQRLTLKTRSEALQLERDALLNERARFQETLNRQQERSDQHQALQAQVNNLAADREALTKQLERVRRDRDELLSKLDDIKLQRARLLAEAAGFEQELTETNEEQAQLQARIKQFADAHSDLTAQRDQLIAERQALITERDQLLARFQGDRESLQQLGADGVGTLRRMIEDLSSQRNTLEHELNQANEALAAAENQLDFARIRAQAHSEAGEDYPRADVLIGLVQEFRTPMTAIIGYVDLLLLESTGILGPGQRKFLLRVSTNLSRLASMLDDLIRVITLDTGQFSLIPESVNVIEIIEESITNATNQIREKALTLQLNLDDDLPELRADRDAINQIVGQLLSNAYLASPPGSEIHITARHYQDVRPRNGATVTDALYLAVEDRGGGIDPGDEASVFNRKYRAENPLIQGMGDTGVGMAIAKALVEAHGGRIWLTSHENVGSTFNVVLPFTRTPNQSLEPEV